MKILMLGWELSPYYSGGLGVACYQIAQALAQSGVEIDYIVPFAYEQEQALFMRVISATKLSPAVDRMAEMNGYATFSASQQPKVMREQAAPFRTSPNPSRRAAPSAAVIEPLRRGNAAIAELHTQPGDSEPVSLALYGAYGSIGSYHSRQYGHEKHHSLAQATSGRAVHSAYSQVSPSLRQLQRQYTRFVADFAQQHSHDGYDIIYAHDWLTFEAAQAARRWLKVPVVAHVHSTEFDRAGGKTGNKLVHTIEKNGLRGASSIIAVSQNTKQIVMERYQLPAQRITVIHNGVDVRTALHQYTEKSVKPSLASSQAETSPAAESSVSSAAYVARPVASKKRMATHRPDYALIGAITLAVRRSLQQSSIKSKHRPPVQESKEIAQQNERSSVIAQNYAMTQRPEQRSTAFAALQEQRPRESAIVAPPQAKTPLVAPPAKAVARQAPKVVAIQPRTTNNRSSSRPKRSPEPPHTEPMSPAPVPQKRIYPVLDFYRKQGVTIVGTMARFTPQKGLVYLLEAASEVLQKNDSVLFVLAGDGEQKEELVRLAARYGIAHRVLFPGFVRGIAWQELYKQFDIFVMSSVNEPFGLTALEAVHYSCATIITKQSGVSEVLTAAPQYDYWDTGRLAELLLEYIADPQLRAEVIAQLKQQYTSAQWGSAAKQYLQLFANTTQSTPRLSSVRAERSRV